MADDEQILTEAELTAALGRLNVAWSALPGRGLVRVVETGSFGAGLVLVNQLAQVIGDDDPEVILRVDEVEVALAGPDYQISEREVAVAEAVDDVIDD